MTNALQAITGMGANTGAERRRFLAETMQQAKGQGENPEGGRGMMEGIGGKF